MLEINTAPFKMLRFAVVVFLDKDEVAIVSTAWIKGSNCFWPPYRFSRLLKALKTHEMPTDEWGKLKIKNLGTYSTYKRANIGLKEAEATSDINCSEVERGNVRRKCRSSDTSDEELPNIELPSAIMCPPPPPPPPQPTNCDMIPVDIQSSPPYAMSSSPRSITSTPKSYNSGAKGDFSTVLRELQLIKNYCRHLTDSMGSVVQILDTLNSNALQKDIAVQPDERNFNLPVKSIEELENLEGNLNGNVSSIEKLARQLTIVAGLEFSNCVRRLMRHLMTDEVASHLSWIGSKGKLSFSPLYMKKSVFDAVRKIPRHADRLDSEIEDCIKNWLRHAPARLKPVK